MRISHKISIFVSFIMAAFCLVFPANALPSEKDIADLEKMVKKLAVQNEEQQKRIEALQKRVEELEKQPALAASNSGAARAGSPAEALDRAVAETESKKTNDTPKETQTSRDRAPATQKLVDISYDIMSTAGWSNKKNADLETLNAGGHDAKKRGFNHNAAELSLTGAVDPYFRGESHIVYTPEGVELEEAFLTTQKLPHDLQLKLGYFLTEFGRVNPSHPHSWHFIDKPVIATRLFGADGLRSEGLRLGWLIPVRWYSEISFGLQNAGAESATSFLSGRVDPESQAEYSNTGLGTGVGGRPMAYNDTRSQADLIKSVRLENSWNPCRDVTAKLGFSGIFGPNGTGPDGKTSIFGTDLTLKWRPSKNFRGWPFLIFEGEYMKRKYSADAFTDTITGTAANDLSSDTLRDDGYYAQLLYGFRPKWAGGVRYEKAGGSGESVGTRAADPFRCGRTRFSPVLIHYPSEFSRLRLQYNQDSSEHLSGTRAGSVWLTYEIMYGYHPAHKF